MTDEEKKKYYKNWQKNNRKWISEYLKSRRKKNRPLCKYCNKKLPYPCSGRLYCKGCSKKVNKKRNAGYRKDRQLEFEKFKLSKGCQKCGYKKCAAALDYHHLDPSVKERRVTARMWKNGKGKLEMKKCILVCKNCHYEIHHMKVS